MLDDLTKPELIARLEARLQRMPERRRAIFLAVRFDRAGYAELAAQHGLTARQVEREFARALLQLDDALCCRRREPWWRRWLRRITGKNFP